MRLVLIILLIIAIIFFSSFLFFFFRYLRMLKRKRRVEMFSSFKEEVVFFSFYPFIAKFSSFLEKLVFLNSLAIYYEQFIYQDGYLKKGMDYISIKLLGGFFFSILSLFSGVFFFRSLSFSLFFLSFLLGMFCVHVIVWLYFKRNTHLLFSSIVDAIFLFNNSLKAGESVERSLKDVIKRSERIVKKEFKKVYSDVEIGLSLGDAFCHFYERTNISFLKEVSILFQLLQREDISRQDVLDAILERTVVEHEKRERYKRARNRNYIAALLFSLLLLISFFVFLFTQPHFFFLLSKYNWLFIGLEGGIYLFYLLLMNYLVRRRYL